MSATPRPTSVKGIPDAERTLVMGVVNVTPDSFSDGGRWFTPSAAVAHGLELIGQGADLLDVGGESTRPGARRVPVQDELDRVLPVVDGLVARGAVVSVDTTRAVVAREAVARGARLVNDVSGGLADDAMYGVVAETGVAYVAMHWRGHADVMDDLDDYDDVVADVRRELASRVAGLRSAGVRDEQIVLDPGLGFAKAGASNWPLLARLPELVGDGFPVLVGASRKRFLGHLLAGPGGEPAPPLARDGATAAVSALAAAAGAWCVRVHEVAGSADAVRVAAAWRAVPDPGDEDELAVDEDARTGGSTR
ncbi:dihydropteroate synthase [Cellulomonas sp. URHD0024]|uniref:dihydropteroate synthase n=1 Tax=Cellulomonas sp. URHD0024 TaxID=1302620 RepID=UPI0009DC33DA|nr:dihydropteroate synthase [Cellulomonas sp. URHD0024]